VAGAEAAKGAPAVRETVEKGRGRIEIRRYVLSDNLDWPGAKQEWAGLLAVGRVESARIAGGQAGAECRYHLSSLAGLERFADVVRGHWAIENGRHRVLDVQFGEDANRARNGHSAEGLALMRRMALSAIRHHGPSKDGLRVRKLRASPNDDCRFEWVLGKPSS
jgi:predicted transposase YbfD/YdcC